MMRQATPAQLVRLKLARRCAPLLVLLVLLASLGDPATSLAQPVGHFNGAKALEYARQFVACGPRYNGSPGLTCAQNFLKKQFAHDNLQDDSFTASTPAGLQSMHNFIVRFPGKKDGVIVLATHYETNYPLRNTSFVGANDGAATTALLIEIANHLRGHQLDGYSVWLVFFDGEEAVESWSHSDSLYGSRHLAAKWQNDGTLKQIKALLLADMIGDKDLDIAREGNSTAWLEDLVGQAASKTGNSSYFFKMQNVIEDDHLPFVQRGVACADIIDYDFGPHDAAHPDGWHHTPEDTLDKISAKSLTVSGEVFLETIRLINAR
jgi:glutaminyl-peptide cyclotransferase